MALKLGWFAVRDVTAADLVPVLERSRPGIPPDHMTAGFRIVDAPATRPSFFDRLRSRPPRPAYASAMLLVSYAGVPAWAEAVSRELSTTTISFFVFEGTWNYVVFDRGERVASMDVWSTGPPVLEGDLDRAGALFGVEPDLFRRYAGEIARACAIDADDDEAFEELEPFPGDEHAPYDEWAHLDFARRLGRIRYPDPDDGLVIDWNLPPQPRKDTRSSAVRHQVGDRVVHAPGRVGEITGFRDIDIAGAKSAFYVIRSLEDHQEDHQEVVVPVDPEKSCIRPLMTEGEIDDVLSILSQPMVTTPGESWSERFAHHMAKVKDGAGPALAEVFRDLSRVRVERELSFGERRMLDLTRGALASEIAAVRGGSSEEIGVELDRAAAR